MKLISIMELVLYRSNFDMIVVVFFRDYYYLHYNF